MNNNRPVRKLISIRGKLFYYQASKILLLIDNRRLAQNANEAIKMQLKSHVWAENTNNWLLLYDQSVCK